MSRLEQGIDPGHADKRANRTVAGVVLLIVGGVLILCGIAKLSSGPSTPAHSTREFFADPEGSMDRQIQAGEEQGKAITQGMLCIMPGLLCAAIGLALILSANAGRLARYQAAEMLPVAGDAAREMTPVISEVVREVAHSVREGFSGDAPAETSGHLRHSCGAMNHPDDKFCKGCGQPLGELRCPRCSARNEPDAKFCSRCGTGLAA